MTSTEFSAYAQKHGLFHLFEELVKELVMEKPADPLAALISALKRPFVPRVLVLGPPASGKHTLCSTLAKKSNATVLDLATVLKDSVDDPTLDENVRKAIASTTAGTPALAVCVAAVVHRTKKPDCRKKGFFLYGFPRTRAEALALQAGGLLPSHVLVLDAPDSVLIERFKGRRVDPQTGAVYHITFVPPPAALATTVQRLPRDEESIVTAGLTQYHRESAGILSAFKSVTHHVNVDQPPSDAADQAWQQLCTLPDSKAPFTPRVLLMGPPGSGCATQAALLAAKYKLTNLSTGTLVRRAVAADTDIGRVCAVYLQRRSPLPDGLLIKLLREALATVPGGWVLRGAPRTREQASAMKAAGIEPSRIVVLQAAEDVCRDRLCQRRVDPVTGTHYSLATAPPAIAARLVQHPSDTEEHVQTLYNAFMEHAEDVLELYPSAQRLDGQLPVATVAELVDGAVVHPRNRDPAV